MLKMVDGTGIIGVDMVCPLGVSTPQPPNYDRVELEGTGMLVLPNSLNAPLDRLELGGKTEQVTTTGVNLFDEKLLLDFDSENYDKTQSGSGFYYYKFPVSGTVTVSTKNANKNGEYLTVGIKPDGSDKTWLSHGSAAISKYKTLTPEDGNIYLGVNNNLERVKSMIQNTGGIIINEGSVATPYEPYTGGKPSPSPEYPQEIKNVGKWNDKTKKYEVDVKITGKNLLDIEKAEVSGGNLCTAKRENNIVKITAIETVTSKRAYAIVSGGGICLKSGKTYFLNGRKVGTSNMTPMFAFFKEKNNGELLKMGNFYTPNEDICIDIGIYLVGDAIRTGNTLEITDIIVCEGKDAAQYQPYTEQTLTITSDRPITKWDRLVEQGGQIGWLYRSEIDDNVKPSRTDLFPYGFSLYKNQENGTYTYKSTNIKKAIGFQTSYCKQFRNKDAAYQSAELWHYSDQSSMKIQYFNTDIATVEEFIEWMESNPLTMVFKTESATFAPLPQSEQNAIRALKTYYPTTVITADGGELDPDIKVTYRKEI